MRENMTRTFLDLDAWGAEDVPDRPQYKTVLFALALFHSVLLERRNYGFLGWNRVYDWTAFDFQVRRLFAAVGAALSACCFMGEAVGGWQQRMRRFGFLLLFLYAGVCPPAAGGRLFGFA